MRVEWILPALLMPRLGAADIPRHDDGILPAADCDAFAGDIRTDIDFLMWDGGRRGNAAAGATGYGEAPPGVDSNAG